MRCFSATLVPDLLRTPEYVAAFIRRRQGPAVTDVEVAWWTRMWAERQDVLERSQSSRLQAVVAESALRSVVGGGSGTLRGQLERLVRVPDEGGPGDLRVLLTGVGYLPGVEESFTAYDLPAGYPSPIACSERLGGIAIHEEGVAELYANAFERLWESALDPQESAAFIGHLATDLSTRTNRLKG
ncbi:DUF5753 domain-containing protein [Phytohabitans suffuscus]